MRKYNLLIIDDEPDILQVYSEFFERRDFEVATAINGTEGLYQLQNNDFDVALVDIRMPDMNGLEVVKQAIAAEVDTSLIILTGHGSRDEAVLAVNSGVDAWFDKNSIHMGELLTKVRELAEVMPLADIRRFLSPSLSVVEAVT